MNRFIANYGSFAIVSRAMPMYIREARILKRIPKRNPKGIKGLKKDYNPDSELFEDTLPRGG